jgi:hypothetical protein
MWRREGIVRTYVLEDRASRVFREEIIRELATTITITNRLQFSYFTDSLDPEDGGDTFL